MIKITNRHITRQTVGDYFLSDHLRGEVSVALLSSSGGKSGWLSSRMKKTRLASGLLTAHETDEREAEQLQSIPSAGRGRDGGGRRAVCPGIQSDAILQDPTWWDPHSSVCWWSGGLVGGGGFPLCFYGNVGFVVFSPPSHMSRCEQTHTCKVCSAIWGDSPSPTPLGLRSLRADCWQ